MRQVLFHFGFSLVILFMIITLLSMIALPFVIFLLGWKEKYRFKPSTYLWLIAGLVGLFSFIEAILFHLQHDPIGVFKAAFFIAAVISLVATKAGKKEFLKMFLIFLLPVLLLAGINVVHPLEYEFAYRLEGREGHVIWMVLGNLWLYTGIWAFACFYRYCVWRIRRLKLQIAK